MEQLDKSLLLEVKGVTGNDYDNIKDLILDLLYELEVKDDEIKDLKNKIDSLENEDREWNNPIYEYGC